MLLPTARLRTIFVLAILAAFALFIALRPAGVSSAHRQVREEMQLRDVPVPSKGVTTLAADEGSRVRATEAYDNLPLSFEVNQGQTDRRVKFLSRGSGYNLFLTSTEAVLALRQSSGARESGSAADQRAGLLRIRLADANPNARIEGLDELPGKSNYFIGRDPKKWRTNVSTYSRVYYHEIYQGVDLAYYGNQRQLENDFIVAPGFDPSVIALAFVGAKKITTDNHGNLLLQTRTGQVQLQKPVIYQLLDGVRQEVAGNYVLKSGYVGFDIAAYDHTRPLVIDPVLVYSSYLGGNGADGGNAIFVDDAGNAYITGDTSSSIFPTVAPFDTTLSGTTDAFIVKINPSGSALIYSTYLGGNRTETGIDISVDGSQNAYVTGRTASSDFPVMNAFDSTYSGGTDEDAFVVRINAAGSALVYSTYLSGNFGARGCGIAANNNQGFAYVTGTTSTGFPVTSGAFEGTNFNSGFLTKLCTNCSGASSLVYSTFLAHTGFAEGRSINADVGGNAYVTGNLNSTTTNFATPGAFQTTYGGGSADAFVEKFNTNVSGDAGRVFATYLGGSAKDIGGAEGSLNPGRAIAIDDSGNSYITGATASTNFPLANAAQAIIGGQNDAFLTKLNATGSALIYSTYLGGIGDDFGKSVAVNIAGGAYVAGVAGPSFPQVNPLFAPPGGCCPFGFVTKFTPSGATVVYSTTLSGVSNGSFGIALDLAGNAFATGNSNALIVTVNPFQPSNGGGGTDGWVSVIADPTVIGRVSDENGNSLSGATVNLTGVPTATTTTDENGGYTFGLLTVGNNYTVSVVAPNYIFNSSAVNNLQKNVRRDFSPVTGDVLGEVTLNGNPLQGVTMTLSGGKSLSSQTSIAGTYAFSNLPAGRNYTVTPTLNSFGFTPQSSTFNLTSSGQRADFTATALPVLAFASATQTVAEGDGAISVTVIRSNDTSGVSKVSWAVPIDAFFDAPCEAVHGAASIRCDYTITTGILTFNPGETTKSFTVLINDDAYVEGNETFSMQLINPNGGAPVMGEPHLTTITITDNDSVTPTTNPLDNADELFFVRQQYFDFLSREPDAGGLAYWTNEITRCGTDQRCIRGRRVGVSNAFFEEREFQQTGAYVYRVYRAAYGNDQPFPNGDPGNVAEAKKIPSYEVFSRDRASVVEGNQAMAQLDFANIFIQRPEFLTRYPATLSGPDFVDALLTRVRNDSGSDLTSQRSALIGLFNSGGRGAVLYRVADDNAQNPIDNRSFIDAEYNRSFVYAEYGGYLRRDSDIGGFLFWLGKVNEFPVRNPGIQHSIVCAFVTSREYQLRFSSVVTHSNSECGE